MRGFTLPIYTLYFLSSSSRIDRQGKEFQTWYPGAICLWGQSFYIVFPFIHSPIPVCFQAKSLQVLIWPALSLTLLTLSLTLLVNQFIFSINSSQYSIFSRYCFSTDSNAEARHPWQLFGFSTKKYFICFSSFPFLALTFIYLSLRFLVRVFRCWVLDPLFFFRDSPCLI